MNAVISLFGILLLASGVITVAAVIIIVFKVVSAAKSSGLRMSDVTDAVRLAKEAEDNPEPRTVFGATKIYLPLIQKDFPDYHNEEVTVALKKFLKEYLEIKYEGREKFESANVERGLETTVDAGSGHDFSDLTIHAAAISSYEKTKEYATVTYVASAGYQLDGKRVEERYSVKYTLKLVEDFFPAKMLVCPQCGGFIESTAMKKCPFCGSGIIRDTVLSWRFTSVDRC